ncbi:replication initiation protein [Herbidospora sp. NEAU-GS84]|uniref:Replication initiation protein n=1 Tax=Herbidospora solisilvae TaxID=2696284 RepID=A0A7C9P1X0_9ACTN|nr:replication initiator [Herbidospora solisilvae]NAS25377.1 replication initiation protein [Herbidospora solisilvae]
MKITQPSARAAVEAVAIQNGICVRPVPVRRYDLVTGQTKVIDIPCGSTLETRCQSCAKRNRQLRMAQCREGWHLDEEPVTTTAEPDWYQKYLIELRADAQARRDECESAGTSTEDYDGVITELNTEIRQAGLRGDVLPDEKPRRTRSTRRRQDAPDLPKRKMAATTLGRVFEANGKTFRPSMFLTLTLPSYGRVRDGVPVDPDAYDYSRAARDALHFSKLVDRFVQNLRRVAGYDVQYFSAVEPQRRLAPHLHMAIRGTLPRAEIKQIAAATYHQVWWPSVDTIRFDGDHLPVWEDGAGYLDPTTGEILPTWDEALDAIDEPLHVVRFGAQVDVKGVLSGTQDADQCVRYLGKYLTKNIGDCHTPQNEAQRRHLDRFTDALRYEPCSPICPNWLRYGVQPKNAKPGMRPGGCRSKAHKPEHLGYAGRRVLVSRKWSGKTLTEHKRDRRAWVLEVLGLPGDQSAPDRYTWRPVKPGDDDVPSLTRRLLKQISERQRWRAAMHDPPDDPPATGQAAA